MNTLRTHDDFNEQAVWDGERYVVTEQGWSSEDGIAWTAEDGAPAAGADYDNAKILFVGGPRGGGIVV
jgi:hypothetical protein